MRFGNYKVCLIEDFTLYFIVIESSSLYRIVIAHKQRFIALENTSVSRFVPCPIPKQQQKTKKQFLFIFFLLFFFPSSSSLDHFWCAIVCVCAVVVILCFVFDIVFIELSFLLWLCVYRLLVSSRSLFRCFASLLTANNCLSLYWEVERTEHTTYTNCIHSRLCIYI